MKHLKHILVVISLLALANSAFAQKGGGTIRGTVFDDANGDPMLFTNVYLDGTTIGTATDINGFYTIPNIPEGDYTLISTALGYDTIRYEFTIDAKTRIITQNIFLKEGQVKITAVEISAAREERLNEVKVSSVKVTTEEISKIPSVGGEPDIAQYLQVMPGVVFTGDQGGQLYIRGGSPVQTLVLLDGLPIYNPFHSIGLFSVFETDIIKNVEVMTGGFSAEYGGRVSAVMDVRTQDGNKKKQSGKVSVSPFMTKAILNGPLIKQKENGSSLTYVLSARYSYLDKTSKSLYPYVEGDNGIPFSFQDYYGKMTYNGGNGSKISLFGFHFSDDANYKGVAKYGWKAFGVGTNFVIVPNGAKTIFSGTIGYSNYNISLKNAAERPRESSVGGFNVRFNFAYFIRAGELNYGFNVNGFQTDYRFFNQLGTIAEQKQNTTELGAYVKFRKNFGKKFILEPSVRFDYYASLSAASVEPRLGMKYNATNWLRFKVAGGMYSQNLISSRADKDVVDLFNGFLSGPEEDLLRPNGEEAKHKLQKAFHVIGGVEVDIARNIQVNIEPYYKGFTQLINVNRSKLFPEESDYKIETGKAWGIDLLVQYQVKEWFVWVTYSFAYVDRYNGEQTYNPHYDRRHNMNIVTAYKFGKDKSWETNLRYNFGTGFPFTRTQGFYEELNFEDGIGTDYTTANGTLGIQYESDLNAGRLPTYHRLDLSIKKGFEFKKDLKLDITASVTNVYNRKNIFYFDRVNYTRVNQLPILPSLAMSFSF